MRLAGRTDLDGPAHCVGAMIVRDGKILLGRRSAHKADAAGCWDLIGGRIEPGERFEDACIREIEEEIAVRAEIDAEVLRSRLASGAEYRIFRVTQWTGEPRIANDEHSEIAWFDVEAACRLSPLAAEEYVALFRAISGDEGPQRRH